ncbi:snoRNA-binding rRNA-processing protein [Blastocladiella emersonii ATCC 22665]|nr:snoRNA-binding rRNA-processing protein [Blastocladiella emersonii ATCC 22665]
MGKDKSMPKFAAKKQRHDPLAKQIMGDRVVDGKKRASKKRQGSGGDEFETVEFLDSKMSKKILDIAQEQQREIEAESPSAAASAAAARPAKASVFGTAAFESDSEDESAAPGVADNEEEWDGGNDDILDVDANEMQVLEQFFPQQPATRQTLADIISEKIAEYEADAAARAARAAEAGEEGGNDLADFLNPKVVQVYSKVGKLLSRYKSGKLPKAFKLIPTLTHWEEVLYITRPDTWTPHAMYEATKIFVSNFNPKMAQRFLNLFLLERVRDDIQNSRKLNYHLYLALKKSLYKPAAFFKGVLLPLVDGGCSLREAAIVGSVVSKVSIPVLHSAACLMKLADMEYSGSASLFLRILLDKKYALPYKVVDAVVFHFLRFRKPEDPNLQLPVLWHQALLVFAQRYKQDITPDQKDALLELLKHQTHYAITPEIRRELVNSESRPIDPAAAAMLGIGGYSAAGGLAGLANMDVEMVDV